MGHIPALSGQEVVRVFELLVGIWLDKRGAILSWLRKGKSRVYPSRTTDKSQRAHSGVWSVRLSCLWTSFLPPFSDSIPFPSYQIHGVRDVVPAALKSGKPAVIDAVIDGSAEVVAEPFRRDALKKPVRFLEKYRHLSVE